MSVFVRLIAAAIVIAPFAGGIPAAAQPSSAVRVSVVGERELQEHRKVTGALRAVARAAVATTEQGVVTAYPIAEGQRVERGDVLVELDNRRITSGIHRLRAEARVAAALTDARTAELELARHDLEALKAIRVSGASNPKELADAESNERVAAARLDEARRDEEVIAARLELEEIRLADTRVTAPFAGVITARHTEVGQWLGEGAVVADLVAVDRYRAWLNVPQRMAPSVIGTGAVVQVSIDATGDQLPAAVPVVVPEVDTTGRLFACYVEVPNPSGRLARGMSVTGWVPTGARGLYLTVPRDALLRNEVGFYVYAARARGEGPTLAVGVPVTVLFEAGGDVAVRSAGLVAGDRVVVEGNERLFPMKPIQALPADAADDQTARAGQRP